MIYMLGTHTLHATRPDTTWFTACTNFVSVIHVHVFPSCLVLVLHWYLLLLLLSFGVTGYDVGYSQRPSAAYGEEIERYLIFILLALLLLLAFVVFGEEHN